jgi:transcriptional regulator with XRE-family HTH domain
MILKQLRLSRNLSQEQLAQMSGLNVRTIQRIESGSKASVESLKCLASVFETDIQTLNQEKFMIDKKSDQWQALPLWLRVCFILNFQSLRPTRAAAKRVEIASHIFGFLFCLAGWKSQPALAGGLLMLANAYIFYFLNWQGDKNGIWYDTVDFTT